MNEKDAYKLARTLARGLFAVADEQTIKVHRIAFKSGGYGSEEKDMGGLCESALVSTLHRLIIQSATQPTADGNV